MDNFFIFQYEDKFSSKTKKIVSVIFVHQAKVNQNSLAQEINLFFQEHSITDKLVIIVPEYLEDESLQYFKEKRDETLKRIPGRSTLYFDESLIVYKYNEKCEFILYNGTKPTNEKKFLTHLLRSGNTIIFNRNGGLVESTPDHHFVFPSGKHCAKFIRTGNVLINHPEIYFLSFQLLRHFLNVNSIFCDTSSINVLPFAVYDLITRFHVNIPCPTIHSFKSYEYFESNNQTFPHDSLVLISSSTSGNIIDRILKDGRATRNQIIVLYFLGNSSSYANHSQNILCNLTEEPTFELGIKEFVSYNSYNNCDLCTDYSRPIEIGSDVFLTIQPKINRHLITVKPEHTPKSLSGFIEKFRNFSSTDSILRSYFKEGSSDYNYEIYFDFELLLNNIDEKRFEAYKETLSRYINKNIPANTKYIIHLQDKASEFLAQYIKDHIPHALTPNLIKLESGFESKITTDDGAVVIVASCITTGKKLLQISRIMRKHNSLNLIYFIGMFRPPTPELAQNLISDLAKGKDKSDERLVIAVEKINSSIRQKNTSWDTEKEFLEKVLSIIDSKDIELAEFLNNRLDDLIANKKSKGLVNSVFIPKHDKTILYLRKNFAFWSFDYKEEEVSQSEVFFTISNIITNIENNNINCANSLQQSNYIRNILSPRNFNRFNDGVVQASILRASKAEFLSYDLDPESNTLMRDLLMTLIDKYDEPDGEALLEFMLALGTKKMKLKKDELLEILCQGESCSDKIISGFAKYVKLILKL